MSRRLKAGRSKLRAGLRLFLGGGVSAGFIWLALRGVDGAAFMDSLAISKAPSLPFAVALLALDYGLRLVRWHWILRAAGSPVGLAACARPFFVGSALNNLLPMRIGDLARVVAYRHRFGLPAWQLFATLVVERTLDLLVLLSILAVALTAVQGESAALDEVRRVALVALAAAGFGLVLVALLARMAAAPETGRDSEPRLFGFAWTIRIRRWLRQIGLVWRCVARPRRVVGLAAISATAWLLEGGVFLAVAFALGRETSGIWLAMSAGTLGTLLPSGPGHVGTFDFFTMTGLVALGTEPSAAAAYAVVVHLVLWLPVTTFGLIFLLVPVTAEPTAVRSGAADAG